MLGHTSDSNEDPSESVDEIVKVYFIKNKLILKINMEFFLKQFQIELQKMAILFVFARERDPVNYLASLMRAGKQEEAEKNLLKFNKSEDLMPYELSKYLTVRLTNMLRSGGSNRFEMDGSPRGYCLIIVNDPEMFPQAEQVESVFAQMLFRVDLKKNVSKKETKKLFSTLTEDYQDLNALVTYLIGHGSNEYFQAKDGLVSIPKLLNSCAENNLGQFDHKPIVHIFDCCRTRKHLYFIN